MKIFDNNNNLKNKTRFNLYIYIKRLKNINKYKD